MSKMYTQRTAALKATVVDSNIINAKKLLIYPGSEDKAQRKDILEILNKTSDDIAELESKNYAYTDAENVFSSANTFEAPIHTNNIVVNGGSLTFTDVIDGTVFDTENPMASGYRYIECIPSSFNNGFCYDIGEISDSTNLKNITFSANGRLIQTCELWFRTPAPAPTNHQWPTNTYWIDSATGAAPTLLASKNYRIVFRQEPKKIIASIAYMY